MTLEEARALVVRTLGRCRTSPENARSVARALVAAEADGLKGHGLSRLPTYAAQAKVGKVDGFAVPTLTNARARALVQVDAANGFAYPALDAARDALDRGAPTRRRRGRGDPPLASLRRRPATRWRRWRRRGLVALFFANTPAAIAPWGGARGLFGTNPIAFALPASRCAADRRGPVAVEGRARQCSRGEAEG